MNMDGGRFAADGSGAGRPGSPAALFLDTTNGLERDTMKTVKRIFIGFEIVTVSLGLTACQRLGGSSTDE